MPSQINIMSTMITKDEIMDPEAVAEQFQRQDLIKRKLQQLQTPVFKSFMIKKSKSIIHHHHRSEHPLQSQPRPIITQDTAPKVDYVPSVTTISFNSVIHTKSTELQPLQSARTLPSFSPLKNRIGFRKTITYIQQNIQQPPLSSNLGSSRPLQHSLSQKIRTLEKRNSQTILRKNSLFLVSALKTRYREIQKRAHIGDIEGVANIKLGHFNEKNGGVTHYQQRFEYMQEAKQRLLMAKVPTGEPKLSRLSPLFPEPW